MVTIKEEQFNVIKHYYELVEVVEEAMQYLSSDRFNEDGKVEQKVIQESLMAIAKIAEANEHLKRIFSEAPEKVRAFNQFESFLDELDRLNDVFDISFLRKETIQHHVAPAFEAWKIGVEEQLIKYIVH
ncbi:hypothetical protein [Bacillus alkalisoli]|uniref:hypothetical protein n=1 Tax=Bacillus alkalisoli TaxID=2011008 RepID=UPI000C24E88D|nr:hypothetical protein [Bacillus alkalisoli]